MKQSQMTNKLLLLMILVVLLSILGCQSEPKVVLPDVGNIDVDFDIIRLDQMVAAIDSNNTSQELNIIMNKYPAATGIYFGSINPYTASDNLDTIAAGLKAFLTDPFVRNLQDTIDLIYGDMADLKEEYTSAYKYLKHYIPDGETPNVYMMNSLFNYQRFGFYDDDKSTAIGVGLDLFLGGDYPYKKINPQQPSFSKYLTRSFSKEHMVRKTVEILVDEKIGKPSGARMLDQMIHNGKRLYLLDKILPMAHDSIIMEYTAAQTKWVQDNELEIWSFFFDEELFYETNLMKINKYLTPSPNSPGMPSEAPGRTGNYIGWKIVNAYMKRYPKATIEDLVAHVDSQKMLEASKYKPR